MACKNEPLQNKLQVNQVWIEVGLDGKLQRAALWTSVAAAETRAAWYCREEVGKKKKDCSAGKATGFSVLSRFFHANAKHMHVHTYACAGRFTHKQAPVTDSPTTLFIFLCASCRDALISGKETKQWKVRKQQQYSHLKGVYFESGTASLSVTELIKSKGHHLQTRHPPKGEHLIPYAAEEASQHPKNTALLEERCSTSLKGSMKN